jgi:osmotically-inducible protein OsmY
MNDPRTKDMVIDVIYNQGAVVLAGTVASPEVAKAAEEIARAQPGVAMVTNELKVA